MKIVFILLISIILVQGSKQYEKVKLKDVHVLTLKENKMTTGRREPPVPQLNCLSNCNGLLPHTVQCTNQGWDGTGIQWECRADLEVGYKFGDLTVTCEGYDYTDDEYILAGSCGLEYTLLSDKSSKTNYGWNQKVLEKANKSGFGMQDLLALGVCAVIIYALYKTCIARSFNQYTQESTTDGDVPPDDRQYPNMGWNIPGTGTHQGFTGQNFPGTGPGCGMPGTGRRNRGGAGGFWTGMATGGLLGYMFGGNNRGANNQHRYYSAPQAPSSGFFGDPQRSFSSSSSGATHSSTGFGGTRRR